MSKGTIAFPIADGVEDLEYHVTRMRLEEDGFKVVSGGWAPDKLRRYDVVNNLIKEINSQNKVIGIICHGGSMAVSADILKGKKATGSLGIKDDLVNAGATWVDEAAFSEGNLVWGRVVADIPDFCREMVKTLNK
jgi:protease I